MKAVLLAAAGVFVTNLALAQERERVPYKFSPERYQHWMEQQEKFDKRIGNSAKRATRSICENFCKDAPRSKQARPEDLLEQSPGSEAAYERAPTPYDMQVGGDGIPSEGE